MIKNNNKCNFLHERTPTLLLLPACACARWNDKILFLMLKWDAEALVKLQAAGWRPVQPLQLLLISPQQGSGSGAARETKWQSDSKLNPTSVTARGTILTYRRVTPSASSPQTPVEKNTLFCFPWIELKWRPPLNTGCFFVVTIKYLRRARSSVMMLKCPAFFSRIFGLFGWDCLWAGPRLYWVYLDWCHFKQAWLLHSDLLHLYLFLRTLRQIFKHISQLKSK